MADHMRQRWTRQIDTLWNLGDLHSRKNIKLLVYLVCEFVGHGGHLEASVDSFLFIDRVEFLGVDGEQRRKTLDQFLALLRLDEGAVYHDCGDHSASSQQNSVAVEDVSPWRVGRLLYPGLFLGRLCNCWAFGHLDKP